jgi:hypothetical protein
MHDFVSTLPRTQNVFKVGRSCESDVPSLPKRDEYKTALRAPKILWKGKREWVAGIERCFIRAGWDAFGARSFNENEGGGDVGAEPVHVVYLVEWEPTPERMLRAMYLKLQREAPPEPQELRDAFAAVLAEAEGKGFKFG